MLTRDKLLDLAREFGTPLYVYDGDMVLDRYRDLFKFIPNPRLRVMYAMKANYNATLLKLLLDAGASLDTVSPGEVLMALQIGYPKEKIIYTANNMTDTEMDEVVATGVLMNIGELSRLEKFGRKYPGSQVCIRFNPDVRDGDSENTMTGGDLAKFGILLDEVDKVREIAARYDLKVIGLHEHTGSGIQRSESVYRSMKNLMALATRENFPELQFLDFGGGFKVPYCEGEERVDYLKMGREINRLFAEYCARYGRELDIYFEPGKFIAAESGYLLVEVNTLKFNRTRTIAGCNSGFPQLIRPVLYGAYHIIENLTNPDGTKKTYDVCGNICETGDRFAEERELPEIREGDILCIRNAGAYCYSMGGVYNLRAMPGEVVVANGKAVLSRRGLSNAELIKQILGETNV